MIDILWKNCTAGWYFVQKPAESSSKSAPLVAGLISTNGQYLQLDQINLSVIWAGFPHNATVLLRNHNSQISSEAWSKLGYQMDNVHKQAANVQMSK